MKGKYFNTVGRNGNALWVSIPRRLALDLGLRQGDPISVQRVGDSILVTPVGDAVQARVNADAVAAAALAPTAGTV